MLRETSGGRKEIDGELFQFGRKGFPLMRQGWSKRHYTLSGSMLTCYSHRSKRNRVLWRGRVCSVEEDCFKNDTDSVHSIREEKKEFIVGMTDGQEVRLRGDKISDVWRWITYLKEALLYREVEDMLGWSHNRPRGRRDRLDDEVAELFDEMKLMNPEKYRYRVDNESLIQFDSPFLIYCPEA